MARMVQCAKLGKEAEGLDFPPLPGELGKRIYESISKEAWQAWLKQQTMLINENRLNMADPRARQEISADDLLEYCPGRVVERHHVITIPPHAAAGMQQYAWHKTHHA